MPPSSPPIWPGPIALVDVEVAEAQADRFVDPRFERARLTLRADRRPVGQIDLRVHGGRLAAEAIQSAISAAQPASGWPAAAPVALDRPRVTAAVCTRGRGASVLDTVASFEGQTYDGPLEILVVDNAPEDDALGELLRTRPSRPERPVRHVIESIPGLSQARNRAVHAATGTLIAFTDDDAVAEPEWIEAIVAGFASDPATGAVSGLTFAAELETAAQEWYENFDGFNRGRGFTRMTFRPRDPGAHPLYPFPTRGAGVNMAFRRDLLIERGGFSQALGAGTGTGGGEDVAMLAEVLLSGHLIAHEPAAVVRHSHRRSEAALTEMMHGYGVGFTAYLLWCLHKHPLASLGLARMIPSLVDYFRTRGGSHAPNQLEVPVYLTRELRRGMPEGPGAYVRAVRRDRRARRHPTSSTGSFAPQRP